MGELELGAAAESTVQAYKDLASEPNQTLLLSQDSTCIQFLAYVVAEGTGTLLQSAVDIFDLLTTNIACRPILATTFGVLESLQELADDERYCEELRNQAAGIFITLQFSRLNNDIKSDSENKNKSDNEEGISEKNTAEQSTSNNKYRKSRKESKKKKEQKFLGPYNNKAKCITLLINGMTTQEHRKQVENELVRVRGLISIVFDLTKSRATCRLKRDLSINKLAEAVSRTEEFKAQQVILTEGVEKIINIGCVKETKSVATEEELPEYLPEDDTPVKDKDSAMQPSGTLREAASTFISTAANLLQNSFYW